MERAVSSLSSGLLPDESLVLEVEVDEVLVFEVELAAEALRSCWICFSSVLAADRSPTERALMSCTSSFLRASAEVLSVLAAAAVAATEAAVEAVDVV